MFVPISIKSEFEETILNLKVLLPESFGFITHYTQIRMNAK